MPGFRQKVAGFIRQLSNPPDSRPCDKQLPKSNECFIQRYLNGYLHLTFTFVSYFFLRLLFF